MPTKNVKVSRAASRRYYEKNKEMYRRRADARKEEAKTYVRSLRESGPCVDCGVSYPWYVMDFDHLPGSGEKVMDVAKLVTYGASRATIDAEVAKCELVCSNCHRIRTHNRRQSDAA